jgi:hypothetical protein
MADADFIKPVPTTTPLPIGKRPSLNFPLSARYKTLSSKYIKNFSSKSYAPTKK